MDIEDRAGKWADERMADWSPLEREDLINAYLAGSAITQAAYASYMAAENGG